MAKNRVYSKYSLEAVFLLAQQIKLGRKQRKWSEQNLADRAGISRITLRKIEQGEMSCAIGLVFEVAMLVGVNLFDQDVVSFARQIESAKDKVALLPKRIRAQVVDDDF